MNHCTGHEAPGCRATTLSVAHCLIALLGAFAGPPTAAEQPPDQSQSEPRPLWEVGVGGFAGTLPDYPAAGQNTVRTIALPYLVYRGDFWRVGGEENRGAISGRFVDSERFEFDLTVSAAFPVDSEDNDAREGMPDLDFLFGIGPQAIFKFFHASDRESLDFHLQARAVYSTDLSSLDGRGYVFNPELKYARERLAGRDLRVSASLGSTFATEKLMDYFYTVAPEFATPVRPAYDADAGYLGSDLTVVLTRRFSRGFRALLGARLAWYGGATNRDSPLFENEFNHSLFAAFAWSFAQSDQPAR
jgi:outer membrane protein